MAGDFELKQEAIYFRASSNLRQAALDYGVAKGLTLSSAVAALAELGLEAAANEESIKALESQVREVTANLTAARVQLAEARGTVEALRERDQKWLALFHGIEGNLRGFSVGKCPKCGREVSAFDQLVIRSCPNGECRQPLDQVIKTADMSPATAGILGAIGGILFGIAASQSGQTNPQPEG